MDYTERKILDVLGEGYKYEGDYSFANKEALSIGSSTLSELLRFGIPFTVGKYGDGYFRIIFYVKH